MEKPIVTTDLGFARSICQDAALYFTPCDARSAAVAISQLVADEPLQAHLKERGLHRLKTFDSAAQRAEKIVILCEQLAQESRSAMLLEERS